MICSAMRSHFQTNYGSCIRFFRRIHAILEPSLKTYKRKLDRDLRHIKLILAHERHNMPVKEWLRLVEDTKACILEMPEDFFCGPLPPRSMYCTAIERVFSGFLEDQRLLALQTPWGFRIPGDERLKHK